MEKKHVQEVLTYDHFISEEVAHVLENAGEVAARARELKNQLDEHYEEHKDWLAEEHRQVDARDRVLHESDKEL